MSRIQLILLLFSVLTIGKVMGQVPIRFRQTSDSLVMSMIGPTYSKFIVYQCERTRVYMSGTALMNGCESKGNSAQKKSNLAVDSYVMAYRLNLRSNIHFDFEVRLDEKGHLMSMRALPDCERMGACDIRVDSAGAIDLAIKSGMARGLGIRNNGLIVDESSRTLQWEIQNQLFTDPDKGEVVYIDAITGQRIGEKDGKWVKSKVY